jgi:coproporphyrinogen III oxidase
VYNGKDFEKGGVNISAVAGEVAETMQKMFGVGRS